MFLHRLVLLWSEYKNKPKTVKVPISLGMYHIIHSQIMQHLDKILSDQQHDFRKRRSCDSLLILTLHDLAAALEKGEQIDAIVLDFSKARDKVSHQLLAIKLVTAKLLQWIESFLAGTSKYWWMDSHLVQHQSPSVFRREAGKPAATCLLPTLHSNSGTCHRRSLRILLFLFADVIPSCT